MIAQPEYLGMSARSMLATCTSRPGASFSSKSLSIGSGTQDAAVEGSPNSS